MLGLEVSRLARNCTDWHRLLEICALTATLILDEDGLYDPAQYNDRLLLGLKGTMSDRDWKETESRFSIAVPIGEVGEVVVHFPRAGYRVLPARD